MTGSKKASHRRGNSKIGSRGAGRQPEYVGIEVELEEDHRHEDEVGGGIPAAIGGFFQERQFVPEAAGGGLPCAGGALESKDCWRISFIL